MWKGERRDNEYRLRWEGSEPERKEEEVEEERQREHEE